MPNRTIYIKPTNVEYWDNLDNRSGFVNDKIDEERGGIVKPVFRIAALKGTAVPEHVEVSESIKVNENKPISPKNPSKPVTYTKPIHGA